MADKAPIWQDPTDEQMHTAAIFLADTTGGMPRASDLMILLGGDTTYSPDETRAKATEIVALLDEQEKLHLTNRLMAIGDEKLTLELDPAFVMVQGDLPNRAELTLTAKLLAQAAQSAIGAPMVDDEKRGIRAAAFRESNQVKGHKMKITRRQLRNLVNETLSLVSETKKKKKKSKKKSKIPCGDDTREDVWSGGDNLVAPIDWEKDLDMIDENSSTEGFKISAHQLRQIIREELFEVTSPFPVYEESGEEEGDHYRDNEEEDEKHLKDLQKDIRYDRQRVK